MASDVFPDVRWGRERPGLTKILTAFASTRVGTWWIRTVTPLDRRLLERSDGRLTMFGPSGVQLLLLNHVGRKSGRPYTTPLVYVREDDRLYLIGSNFGRPEHPNWSTNILARPDCVVTMGGKDIPVTATLLGGDERQRILEKFIDYVRTYNTYLHRTDRNLRIFEVRLREDPAAQ